MQSDTGTRIGELVRSERERQGLKQDELALAAGVSYRTVLQIEKGKPTSRLDVLLRVLEALGLTLEVRAAPRSLSHAGSLPLARFEIDEHPTGGGYGWSLIASDGERLAFGPEEYPSRVAALRAVRELASLARGVESLEAGTDVYRDPEGAYGWRLRVRGGRLLAEGPASYGSRAAAIRAARHVLLTATSAEVA